VSEVLDLTSPVVGRPAGLHDDNGRGGLGEEDEELGSVEASVPVDASGLIGDGDLKLGLCEVDSDDGTLLHGLLLVPLLERLCHLMPTASIGGVHSINEADKRATDSMPPACSALTPSSADDDP
jgi:hypothetical protein